VGQRAELPPTPAGSGTRRYVLLWAALARLLCFAEDHRVVMIGAKGESGSGNDILHDRGMQETGEHHTLLLVAFA